MNYLLHEIGSSPSIGKRNRFGNRHARRLLADLPAVLAFHLDEPKFHRETLKEPSKTLESN